MHYQSFIINCCFLMILFFICEGHIRDKWSLMDSCVINRYDPNEANTFRQTNSTMLFFFSIEMANVMLVFYFVSVIFGLSLKSDRRETIKQRNNSWHSALQRRVNFRFVFECCFLGVWQFASTFFLEALKVYLGDTTCSNHANSVSGHANWVIFFILSALGLYQDFSLQKRKSSVRSRAVQYVVLFNLVSFITIALGMLSLTVRGGYHSVRQILYGLLNGLIWHCFSALLLEYASAALVEQTSDKENLSKQIDARTAFGRSLRLKLLSGELIIMSGCVFLVVFVGARSPSAFWIPVVLYCIAIWASNEITLPFEKYSTKLFENRKNNSKSQKASTSSMIHRHRH